MRTLDSSPLEMLAGYPEGSRYFMARIWDPEARVHVRGSIALDPAQLDEIRTALRAHGLDYEDFLGSCATVEIVCKLFGGTDWPEGYDVDSVEEVSREQLVSRILEMREQRGSSAG